MNKSTKIILVIIVAIVAVLGAGAAVFLNAITPDKTNDLTITSPGTVVNGGTYDNITIADSVGDGDVTLNGVKILGKLIVNGGGSNTVKLTGCTVSGAVEVDKDGGQAPRILVSASTVSQITANSDTIIQTEDNGSVSSVSVNASQLTVRGEDTVIGTVVSDGDSTLSITDDATVEKVSQSKGSLVIESTGTINTVEANDAAITIKGDDTSVGMVRTSGTTTVNVADSASVSNVTQTSGTITVTGTGSVDTLSVTGNVEADSSIVNSISVEKTTADSTISITGDKTVSVIINTNTSVSISAPSATVDVGVMGDTVADVTVNDTEVEHIHSLVKIVDAEATCVKAGSMHFACRSDDGFVTDPLSIPANGHTPNEAVRENVVDSTTTEKGTYDSVVYCSVCGDEISRTKMYIDVKESDGSMKMEFTFTIYNIGNTTVRYEETSTYPDGQFTTSSEHLTSITLDGRTYQGNELASFLTSFEPTMDNIVGMKYTKDENDRVTEVTLSVTGDSIVGSDGNGSSSTYEDLDDFKSSWNRYTELKYAGLYVNDYRLSQTNTGIGYTDNFVESSDGASGTIYYGGWNITVYPVHYMIGSTELKTVYESSGQVKLNMPITVDGKTYLPLSMTVNGENVEIGTYTDVNTEIFIYVEEQKTADITYVNAETGEIIGKENYVVGTDAIVRYLWTDDDYEYRVQGHERDSEIVSVPEQGLTLSVSVNLLPRIDYVYEGKTISIARVTGGQEWTEHSDIPREVSGAYYVPVKISDGYQLDVKFVTPQYGHVTVTLAKTEVSYIIYKLDSEEVKKQMFMVGKTVQIPVNPGAYGYEGVFNIVSITDGYSAGVEFEMPSHDIVVVIEPKVYAYVIYECDGSQIGRTEVEVGTSTMISYRFFDGEGNTYIPVSNTGGYKVDTWFVMPAENINVQEEKVKIITLRELYDGKEGLSQEYVAGHETFTIPEYQTVGDVTYRATSVTDDFPFGELITAPDHDVTVNYESFVDPKIIYQYNGKEICSTTCYYWSDSFTIPGIITVDGTDYVPVSLPDGMTVGEKFSRPDHDLVVTVELRYHSVLFVCDGQTVDEWPMGYGDSISQISDRLVIDGATYDVVSISDGFQTNQEIIMPAKDVTVTLNKISKYSIYYVFEGDTLHTETFLQGDQASIEWIIDVENTKYCSESCSGDYRMDGCSFEMPAEDITVYLKSTTVYITYVCGDMTVCSETVYNAGEFTIKERIYDDSNLERYRYASSTPELDVHATHSMFGGSVVVTMVNVFYDFYRYNGDVIYSAAVEAGSQNTIGSEYNDGTYNYRVTSVSGGHSADEEFTMTEDVYVDITGTSMVCYVVEGKEVELRRETHDEGEKVTVSLKWITGSYVYESIGYTDENNVLTMVRGQDVTVYVAENLRPAVEYRTVHNDYLQTVYLEGMESYTIPSVIKIGDKYYEKGGNLPEPYSYDTPFVPPEYGVIEAWFSETTPCWIHYVCGDEEISTELLGMDDEIDIQTTKVINGVTFKVESVNSIKDSTGWPEKITGDLTVSVVPACLVHCMYDGEEDHTEVFAVGDSICIDTTIHGTTVSYHAISVTDDYPLDEEFTAPGKDITVNYVSFHETKIDYCYNSESIYAETYPYEATACMIPAYITVDGTDYRTAGVPEGLTAGVEFPKPDHDLIVVLEPRYYSFTFVCGDQVLEQTKHEPGEHLSHLPQIVTFDGNQYRIISVTNFTNSEDGFTMPSTDVTVTLERVHSISYVFDGDVIRYETYPEGESVAISRLITVEDTMYYAESCSGDYDLDGQYFDMPAEDITVNLRSTTVYITYVCDGETLRSETHYNAEAFTILESISNEQGRTRYMFASSTQDYSGGSRYVLYGGNITVTMEKAFDICFHYKGEIIDSEACIAGKQTSISPYYYDENMHAYPVKSISGGHSVDEEFTMTEDVFVDVTGTLTIRYIISGTDTVLRDETYEEGEQVTIVLGWTEGSHQYETVGYTEEDNTFAATNGTLNVDVTQTERTGI